MKTEAEIYYEQFEKPMLKKYKEMVRYFQREIKNGKNEFRIAFSDDTTFYIHPLGKNGETFDSNF